MPSQPPLAGESIHNGRSMELRSLPVDDVLPGIPGARRSLNIGIMSGAMEVHDKVEDSGRALAGRDGHW